MTEEGSLISVDGVAQLQDLSTLDPSRPYGAVMAYGDAGSVVIKAQDEVELRGSLSGRAPGSTSAGGSFALELTNRDDSENPRTPHGHGASWCRRLLRNRPPMPPRWMPWSASTRSTTAASTSCA